MSQPSPQPSPRLQAVSSTNAASLPLEEGAPPKKGHNESPRKGVFNKKFVPEIMSNVYMAPFGCFPNSPVSKNFVQSTSRDHSKPHVYYSHTRHGLVFDFLSFRVLPQGIVHVPPDIVRPMAWDKNVEQLQFIRKLSSNFGGTPGIDVWSAIETEAKEPCTVVEFDIYNNEHGNIFTAQLRYSLIMKSSMKESDKHVFTPVADLRTACTKEKKLWLVFESLEVGSLDNVIRSKNGMPEPVLSVVVRDVLDAVDALHEANVRCNKIDSNCVWLSTNGKVKLFALSSCTRVGSYQKKSTADDPVKRKQQKEPGKPQELPKSVLDYCVRTRIDSKIIAAYGSDHQPVKRSPKKVARKKSPPKQDAAPVKNLLRLGSGKMKGLSVANGLMERMKAAARKKELDDQLQQQLQPKPIRKYITSVAFASDCIVMGNLIHSVLAIGDNESPRNAKTMPVKVTTRGLKNLGICQEKPEGDTSEDSPIRPYPLHVNVEDLEEGDIPITMTTSNLLQQWLELSKEPNCNLQDLFQHTFVQSYMHLGHDVVVRWMEMSAPAAAKYGALLAENSECSGGIGYMKRVGSLGTPRTPHSWLSRHGSSSPAKVDEIDEAEFEAEQQRVLNSDMDMVVIDKVFMKFSKSIEVDVTSSMAEEPSSGAEQPEKEVEVEGDAEAPLGTHSEPVNDSGTQEELSPLDAQGDVQDDAAIVSNEAADEVAEDIVEEADSSAASASAAAASAAESHTDSPAGDSEPQQAPATREVRVICPTKVNKLLQELGIPQTDDPEATLQAMDVNGSGHVEMEDFVDWWGNLNWFSE